MLGILEMNPTKLIRQVSSAYFSFRRHCTQSGGLHKPYDLGGLTPDSLEFRSRA
jgi:hypothetical protein